MMDEARPRKYDLVLVWKLDRLSRSLKDLFGTLDELVHLGIDFISYDNIYPRPPGILFLPFKNGINTKQKQEHSRLVFGLTLIQYHLVI
jgi:DNA invertase Pin-like site-specific DNA recombinase